MSGHEGDQVEQHMMEKLQQIIPELRKELEAGIRNRHKMEIERAKQARRKELQRENEVKLREIVAQKNREAKEQLVGLAAQVQKLEHEAKNIKPRVLTHQEQEEVIDQTIEEIISNPSMLQEVKNRMRPQVEAQVKKQLEAEFEEALEEMTHEIKSALLEQRKEWVEERRKFWQRQAEMQLEQIEQEENELNARQMAIEATYMKKKNETQQLERRLREVQEQNQQISHLRKELASLKRQVRV